MKRVIFKGPIEHTKLLKDNRGSGIILVIIAMAMIGVLATSIVWSSFTNFKIKVTEKNTKISFYEAETVLEEIMAGLQNEASQAIDIAYKDVMKNWMFDEASGTTSHTERFAKAYINALYEALKDPSSPAGPIALADGNYGTYDLDKLKSYVSMQNKLDTLGASADFSIEWTPTLYPGTDMDIILADGAKSLILTNLSVKYTDNTDYVSQITTDISFDIPNLAFTQEADISDLHNSYYKLIGAKGVEVVGTSTDPFLLKDSLYAGEDGITIGNPMTNGYLRAEDTSFSVSDDKKLTVFSEGDVMLNRMGSRLYLGDEALTKKYDLFAKGIINCGSSNLDISASTFVSNDLELRESSSKANLHGAYYGYGNQAKSDESSAILINGTNCTLNLEVTDLLIAGTAFIGSKHKHSDTVFDTTSESTAMGESIAVKGNQVAYLVPPECVMVKDPAGGNTGEVYGSNPVNLSDLTAKGIDVECDISVPVFRLNNKSLSSLGVTTVRAINDAPSGMRYYYMVFGSNKAASNYFETYYSNNENKNKQNRYLNKYASGGIVLGADSADLTTSTYNYTIAGNSFVVKPSTLTAPGEVRLINPNAGSAELVDPSTLGPDDDVNAYSDNSEDLLNDLDAAGVNDQIRDILSMVDSEENKAKSWEKLIDEDAINNDLKSDPMYFVATGSGKVAVITKHDFTLSSAAYASDDIGLIISMGDITIDKNFKGMAYAKNNLILSSVSAPHVAEADPTTIYEALNATYNDGGTIYTPYSYFKTKSVQVDDTGLLKIDYTNLVRYRNWIKQ